MEKTLNLWAGEPSLIVDGFRPPLPADDLRQLTELPAGEAVVCFLTTAAMVPREYVAQMRDTPAWSSFEAVAQPSPCTAARASSWSARHARARAQRRSRGPGPVLLDFFRSDR